MKITRALASSVGPASKLYMNAAEVICLSYCSRFVTYLFTAFSTYLCVPLIMIDLLLRATWQKPGICS